MQSSRPTEAPTPNPRGRAFEDGPWTAGRVAALVGGRLHGEDRVLSGVAELGHAGSQDLAYAEGAVSPGAAGLLLAREAVEGQPTVVVADPKGAMIAVLAAAFPEAPPSSEPMDPDGLGQGALVHPQATVHASARLGARVMVHAGARVGADCVVGDDTVLFENVVLYPRTVLGRRCRVHAGAVLGSDGFSYHPGPQGALKVPQVGRVRVEDDVELGANTCIDRAFLGETVIGAGSKLDNLVQIGHNSRLGRGVVIAGQAGLSGSVTVGDGVQMGGQVGVADHASIGAGARLAARSGVHGRVAQGAALFGAPAMPLRTARRVAALVPRLPELFRRLRELERRLGEEAPPQAGPPQAGPPQAGPPQAGPPQAGAVAASKMAEDM